MYMDKQSPVEAVRVLRNALQSNPPCLPPLPLLTRLCHALEKTEASAELHFTISVMIQHRSQVIKLFVLHCLHYINVNHDNRTATYLRHWLFTYKMLNKS